MLRLTLRVFFRRVEVAGLERVPDGGPVIFVLNHPNGLIDPAFVMCLAPRRVSFLAKAPLFKMPVVGFFVRALDSLPIYRHQDAAATGADVSRNRETFVRCRELLTSGGALAVCPEGVSHNEPSLRPLKTGTARIALGAASSGDKNLELKIIPAGLYYTAKTAFRSSALLYFGEPLEVAVVDLDAAGEPPAEAVHALSARIEAALREVILNAEHDQALATVARAERIFTSADGVAGEGKNALERELKLRRRFVEGYDFLRRRAPARLIALETRLARYEAELDDLNLDTDDLAATSYAKRSLARYLLWRTILFASLAPLALAGLALHYPAYKAAGVIATRFARQDADVVSTFKIGAAMLLFPLTWLLAAALAGWFVADWRWVAAAFVVAPLAGYAALRFAEGFDRFVGGARALSFFLTRRWFYLQLLAERRAIREEILALGEEATAKKG